MSVTVKLDSPIKRGEKEINEVSLRKPKAGELRGLKIVDLIQMDVAQVLILVPRISDLTEDEMQSMDTENLMTIATEVAGFFISSKASLSA